MPAVDLKLIFAVLGALCVALGSLNGGRAARGVARPHLAAGGFELRRRRRLDGVDDAGSGLKRAGMGENHLPFAAQSRTLARVADGMTRDRAAWKWRSGKRPSGG